MDRLAEKAIGILNDCCEDAPETGCGLIDFDDYGQIMNALEKLRAYEDAEEQGRLMRLPESVLQRYQNDEAGTIPDAGV